MSLMDARSAAIHGKKGIEKMKINWRDFVFALVIWIFIEIALWDFIGSLSVLQSEPATGQPQFVPFGNWEAIWIPPVIATSISIIFYLIRNRRTTYPETAVISGIMPVISITALVAGVMLFTDTGNILGFLLVSPLLFVFFAVLGLAWRFILEKQGSL